MDSNGYYTGKHSSFMLPPVNYQIQYDSFTDYQTSSQQQQQQQQQHHQLPHQVQQHHDIQSTISVKLDTINKSPSQKNDEIQACSGGYTGNSSSTSSNDFHSNLYHYNKNLDSSDGIAGYNQPSVVSNYSDFDHIGATSSIGQKSLSSFLPQHQQQHHQPQQQQQQQQHQSHQSHNQQQQQQQQQQSQHIQQSHNQHPPTAAIIPQAIGNVQNDISQQSKVLGAFDQRTSTNKCYNSKPAPATNSLHGYQQTGYKDSEMPFNFNKLPPIPHTYHHVFPSYDKYSIQPRATSHHKSYDDNPTNSRPYVCQTMPMATNHKPTSQSELFCSSSAATEQLNRFSNRNFLIPNSAFTTPTNGYYAPMYHRSNNVHRNLSLPPPLQPAIDDSSTYYNNNLLVRGGSYNRSQMAFQQTHYPYARSHHPMPIPKLQSKSDIDIMSGLTDEIYRPTYNVSYDHFDEYQFSQVPPVTHYPTKSSKVIYAPYSSNTMSATHYPPNIPSTTHQQSLSTAHQQQQQQHQQQQQQQQQHHNMQPQQHHQSVIQNQVLSSNDYSRYSCSNVQPSPVNCSNKVYLQDQYAYSSHPQMIYSHSTSEVAQTEMPTKFNQIYDKHATPSTDKLAFVDLEEQITGSKILKTREITPSRAYDCYNGNNNNSYQQLRVSAEQEASKNQSLRDFLVTWNDDEEEEGEAIGEKKLNARRIAAVDVMPRSCGQSKLELDGASNVSTPKIHYGIKVDNGGVPTKNLPDIIIDIEKPKVAGSDESYSSVDDKLYVLESIHVPFSDLNKYKHLNVVNKLPDNIVQIDRPKGDSLDDVEETLKLIEKCEERVRLHKSDFELDVKFEGEEACVSPIRRDCSGDAGQEKDISMLNDPLNIHENPDADQHAVPAPSPTVELDDENLSNAHNKTANDGQEDDDIDDEEMETMNDGDSEVVRYKCVQKKVSTNDDELIHSDVSIPKLKIKIMRRKRSKSFRNRKNKNSSDSSDSHDEIKLRHLEETTQVKTLKLICLDAVNTNSFRKYLISVKENESQNVFQYSGPIENNIECVDKLKNDVELINESVEVKNIPSDLIEIKNVNDSAAGYKVSDDDRDLSPNVSGEETDKSPSTFDNDDHSNNSNSSCRYDHSLSEVKFHTPSVAEDFSDPHFDTNFESVRSINLGNDLPSTAIVNDDTNEEISPILPINTDSTTETQSVSVDNINETESIDNITSNTRQQTNERGDKCIENVQDAPPLVASLLDNLETTTPSNRVEVSELMDSLDEFEQLIESSDNPMLSENSSAEKIVVACPPATNLNETQVSTSIESKDELTSSVSIINIYKTEPDYTDSSSSSCSSSDDSSDSECQTEMEILETKRQNNSTSVTNNARVSSSSCSSSDESDDLDDKSSAGSSRWKLNPNSRHTDSESVYTKSSSNESDVTEPKVKIENEVSAMPLKSDDRISHHSDNGFKSNSYSSSSNSSSSDNSDESSSESDDEIVPDSVSKIEKIKPEENSPFVAIKIKTEDPHPYSDTTDESSIESCDETESETVIKDTSKHDKESVKSNSSSDTSDDECISQSPIKSVLIENDIESSKTSSDTELSDEDDKKSCSSNPSSVLSAVTEKNGSLSGSVTESETCTAGTITPVSKKSSSNSDESDMQERLVTGEFIKTEPIHDDSHIFHSCSDNSDDEYVKLSPLNLLDECSATNNHIRKLTLIPNKNAAMTPARSKKETRSSDGYSTSSSSSSSSQSSSSDEYSSDDDVFETKSLPTVPESDANLKIDSIEPIKTIKNEIEDLIEQGVQTNQENQVERIETPSEVEEEVVHNLENDLSLDTIGNNPEESENIVEAANDLSCIDVNVKDTLLDNADHTTEEKHLNSSDIVPHETIGNVEVLEELDSESTKLDEDVADVADCSASDCDNGPTTDDISEPELSKKFDAVSNCSGNDGGNGPTITQSIDFEKQCEETKDTEVDSCRTSCIESIDNTEEAFTVADEVNSKTSTSTDDNESVESKNESEIDSERNSESSTHIKRDDRESYSSERDEGNFNMSDQIDVVDNVAVALQSCEPIEMDSQILLPVEDFSLNVSSDQAVNELSVVRTNDVETTTNHPQRELIDSQIPEVQTISSIETSLCYEEHETESSAPSVTEISTGTEIVAHSIESTDRKSSVIEIDEVMSSPTRPKDLVYPVLDIPVKLIPLPGERFNEELYQKLIDNSEIFPSRKPEEIDDFNEFYSKIPLELIPLPDETINEKAPHFVEYKRKYLEERKSASHLNGRENIESSLGVSTINVTNQEGNADVSQSVADQSPFSRENDVNKNHLVICDSLPSLKVLCQRVLSVAGLYYDEDDELATSIDGDNENISYFYVVNDNDDFWNCSNESSSPLIVCYDGELDDDVFVESDFDAAINLSENQVSISEHCSITSQSLSIDSFTIDSHDIQYEETVPVNRTMYKLENFKRYLQSKYIQKPNYIQIYCINKILKKYSNYQRYRKRRGQATVQKCKKQIENYKNLLKHPKNNETLPLVTDRFTVKDNGQVPKNDVLRSNCDINKSKLLLLNNNNIKSKRNLNSTQRNHKLNKCEVSTISSYVSEMTKNNHLKESRAFAKEIITNKRSIKSNAKATSTPIVEKSKKRNLSHGGSPSNQIAIHKRKVSESIVEPMSTRNNKKRKLSFDDTLLGINRIYKQISAVDECEKIETKASSSSYKLKERSREYFNSNILNNSKDKVRRLIIPKSKIFDGPNVCTKSTLNSLVQVPYVKLVRNPYIDSLGKSYAKSSFAAGSRK